MLRRVLTVPTVGTVDDSSDKGIDAYVAACRCTTDVCSTGLHLLWVNAVVPAGDVVDAGSGCEVLEDRAIGFVAHSLDPGR
jgi:hypothetical protein